MLRGKIDPIIITLCQFALMMGKPRFLTMVACADRCSP